MRLVPGQLRKCRHWIDSGSIYYVVLSVPDIDNNVAVAVAACSADVVPDGAFAFTLGNHRWSAYVAQNDPVICDADLREDP